MRKRYWFIFLLAAVGSLYFAFGGGIPAGAETLTHIVEKGDTLWSICEKYYGDPDLWPKLWQMNPFVTNPHLLKPGDTIILLEGVPVEKPPVVREKKAPKRRRVKTTDDLEKPKTGIDVSELTNVNANGYLTARKVIPWGRILATETKRIILAVGDKITVAIKIGRGIKPGDQFAVYQRSSLLRHPLTRRKVGYALSFLARLVVKEEVGKGLWQGEIIESFRPVRIGDPILPHRPISSCIELRPLARGLTSNIVAVKDLAQVIGHTSVVYLAHGYNHGIRTGNIFEVVRKRHVRAPGKISLPDVALGRLLVLEARPNTATGVIISIVEEFAKGAFLRSLDWEEAQRAVSDLPLCRIE